MLAGLVSANAPSSPTDIATTHTAPHPNVCASIAYGRGVHQVRVRTPYRIRASNQQVWFFTISGLWYVRLQWESARN